jgi:acetyltransferase-like isoleucine patch superfamily enzyme
MQGNRKQICRSYKSSFPVRDISRNGRCGKAMKQIDKTAKIWQPTTILEANREIFIGPDCRIGQFCFIAPRRLTMERGAEVSPLAVLGGGGDIYMCSYSTVDYGAKLIPATFTTDGLYMNDAMLREDTSKVHVIRGSITLKEGAVVGSNAVVCVSKRCKDIVIGKHSVVGAGVYLDRSIPDDTVILPKNWELRTRGRKEHA